MEKESFRVIVHNKTDHSIKINWDEAVYVNPNKYTSKIVHSGVDNIKVNDSQVSSTIPSGAILEDIIIPVNNIKHSDNNRKTETLFPYCFQSESCLNKAKELEGKTVSLLLPIQIENIQNDYIFYLTIDNVETLSYSTIKQEHDIKAETSRTIGTVLLTTMAAGVIVGLLSLITPYLY